jgi:hypothetical protein
VIESELPLARNALLFTLIVDDHCVDHIWNIFYHFKLDDISLSLLTEQCKKLVSISNNLDSWLASPYSAFLRICSSNTLSRLHHHWRLYAQSRDLLKNKNDSLFSLFTKEFEARNGRADKTTINYSASRSAGLFWVAAMKPLNTNFEHYWRTGTVYMDTDRSAKFMNPTFVYSMTGEGCALHYGSYPLQCFHLASAASSRPAKDLTINDFISCAKTQFRQWCNSFMAAVSPASPKKVTIRLFSGDALAFCRTLHHCQVASSTSASLFVSPWAEVQLDLDSGDYGTELASAAPTTFDVIDTSNITDHVGLLNVLIVTIPILFHRPSSTLYTETLCVEDKDAVDAIVPRLYAEIPTMSLLLGVAPTAYVSNFQSHSNVHELLALYAFKGTQYHERIAWKVPHLGDPVAVRECGESTLYPSYDPSQLTKLLFDIYYHMFADENISHKLQKLQSLTLVEPITHYNRGTFAALLGLIKSRVKTNWIVVMENIFQLLHNDRKLLLGSNNYQELCCQLYLRGVYCVEPLRPNPTCLDHINWSKGRFQGW